ncbi:hypothetical protein NMG60_11000618 [Bertholletia excelsa]
MVFNLKPHLCLLVFYLYTISISAIKPSDDAPTVYEILPKFGLPGGLLLNSVKSYSLSSNGSFVVELEKPCYVQFDYLVYYEKQITGTLKYGSITNLEGIQVQRVDLPPSDSIYFRFKTVHSCRDEASGSCTQSWKSVLQVWFSN